MAERADIPGGVSVGGGRPAGSPKFQRQAVIVGVSEPQVASAEGEPFKRLAGVKDDVERWAEVVEDVGFDGVQTLEDSAATVAAVTEALKSAVKAMPNGGLLFFVYSGHGGLWPTYNDEAGEGRDEAMVLHDGALTDDWFGRLWSQLGRGTNVVVISDSCHSATQFFLMAPRSRLCMPADMQTDDVPPREIATVPAPPTGGATVLWLAACQDNQQAHGDVVGGWFNRAISNAWRAEPDATWQRLWDLGAHHLNRTVHAAREGGQMSGAQTPVATAFGPVRDEFVDQMALEPRGGA